MILAGEYSTIFSRRMEVKMEEEIGKVKELKKRLEDIEEINNQLEEMGMRLSKEYLIKLLGLDDKDLEEIEGEGENGR